MHPCAYILNLFKARVCLALLNRFTLWVQYFTEGHYVRFSAIPQDL